MRNNSCGPVSSAWYLWLHTLSGQTIGNQPAFFRTPPPSPTQTFPCTFLLLYIRTNLTLTMVCTCCVSLLGFFTIVSPPFHFFCPLLLFDMDHWTFHQLLWIPPFAHPALFMKPFFCLAWLFFFFFFLKHIYTKSWCVALSADIRKVSFQCARLI